MPNEIQPGPHPNIVCLRLYGDITPQDMTIDEELGLNQGKPIYLLMDASGMTKKLPRNFLESATNSFFINENLRHMVLYTGSEMLDLLAKTVANLTHRRTKLSIHKTREEAIRYLMDQINEAFV